MGSVYVPGIIMAGIRQPSVSLRLCWVEEGRGCCKMFRQREMYFIVFVLVFLLNVAQYWCVYKHTCTLSARLNF